LASNHGQNSNTDPASYAPRQHHLISSSPHHGIPPHIDELTKTLLIIQTFLESGGYYHTRMMG